MRYRTPPAALLSLVLLVGCDVFLAPDNRAPVAMARGDLLVAVGEEATLDGSASHDPDDDPLTYYWEIQDAPAGAAALLQDAATEAPRLTPDAPGAWVVALTVSDGELTSEPATVGIQVTAECELGTECGPGHWKCTDSTCSCAIVACGDGHCRDENECCVDVDCDELEACGVDHLCGCAAALCGDGHCPLPDECCTHDECGLSGYCQAHQCQSGGEGTLVLEGSLCTLSGEACPGYLQRDGFSWTLDAPEVSFTHVHVLGNAILTGPATTADGEGGRLELVALGEIRVGPHAAISMSGRGWGGGGGGGGRFYCSTEARCYIPGGGQAGHSNPDGMPGGNRDELPDCPPASTVHLSFSAAWGGAGGGYGGQDGSNGDASSAGMTQEETDACFESVCTEQLPRLPGDSSGGSGGGPFGGAGGVAWGSGNLCPSFAPCGAAGEALSAEAGYRGGYLAAGGNGDTSVDESVEIGSGGGGGAGGDASNRMCCGSAAGGSGGSPGTPGRMNCTGGGGGGGGGAGGGVLVIRAADIVLQGAISATGAGRADLDSGYGAGGGILLQVSDRLLFDGGVVRSLGGYGDGVGTQANGGTAKLFCGRIEGQESGSVQAGRVHSEEIPP